MPQLQLPDCKLFYETAGQGEPLVLVPGFASGAWSWAGQVDDLSADFRVITFDPRGVSRSKLNEGAFVSIRAIAEDVAALLDRLDVETAHVMGISFGGFVAQELALAYPERLGKLVLASTSFGGPNHVAPTAEVLAAFELRVAQEVEEQRLVGSERQRLLQRCLGVGPAVRVLKGAGAKQIKNCL